MFLKHLFLCENKSDFPHNLKTHLIPIFIQARSFIKNNNSLEELLFIEVTKHITLNFNQFQSDLKNGGFLLLFDGLDEIKSSELSYFSEELNILTEKYPNNSYVTSSRPSEQCEALRKFASVSLNSFSLDSAMLMISKLPNIDAEYKLKFNKLLIDSEFEKNKDIASNPLLLTLMFMIFMNDEKLPSKTYEFYEKAYDLLYFEHDKVKGFKDRKYHTNLKKIEFMKVLAEFCYITMTNQDYQFSEFDIIQIINESSFSNKISPDDFIYDIVENLNLLYLQNNKYHFIHRSFQEYFAAVYWRLMSNNDFIKLVDWLEQLNITTNNKFPYNFDLVGEKIFSLLYEMLPTRTTELIIKPYIKDIIYDDSINSFLNFTKHVYKDVVYGLEETMRPTQYFMRLLIACYADNYFVNMLGTNYPKYDKYIKNKYWFIKTDYPIPQAYTLEEINKCIEDKSLDEKKIWLNDNKINLDQPHTYTLIIPVDDIISNTDNFKELLQIIYNPNHQLYKNFISLYKLIN